MLQLSKANKGRKSDVPKVRRQKDKPQGHGRDVRYLRQDLIEKIDHAQKQESKWYEEGNKLKAQFDKLYGNENY